LCLPFLMLAGRHRCHSLNFESKRKERQAILSEVLTVFLSPGSWILLTVSISAVPALQWNMGPVSATPKSLCNRV
jgi:hypothetical protein